MAVDNRDCKAVHTIKELFPLNIKETNYIYIQGYMAKDTERLMRVRNTVTDRLVLGFLLKGTKPGLREVYNS